MTKFTLETPNLATGSGRLILSDHAAESNPDVLMCILVHGMIGDIMGRKSEEGVGFICKKEEGRDQGRGFMSM